MYRFVDEKEEGDTEKKNLIAEWFFETYSAIQAVDVYTWLWEGEYGCFNRMTDLSLDCLTEDIRLARMHMQRHRENLRVWEPLGLALTLVKINLMPYADSGCPLKRLIMLEERARDLRPNHMRFKHDWALMKTHLIPGMTITLETINDFENSIPFHLVPEMGHSESFVNEYGLGYRIVPRTLFFDYFPEYEFEAVELNL